MAFLPSLPLSGIDTSHGQAPPKHCHPSVSLRIPTAQAPPPPPPPPHPVATVATHTQTQIPQDRLPVTNALGKVNLLYSIISYMYYTIHMIMLIMIGFYYVQW